jgi:hypothetical protein
MTVFFCFAPTGPVTALLEVQRNIYKHVLVGVLSSSYCDNNSYIANISWVLDWIRDTTKIPIP